MFGNDGDPNFLISKMQTVDNHVDCINNINNIIY